MFKRHHQVFTALRVLLDVAIVAVAFWGAYRIRFGSPVTFPYPELPDPSFAPYKNLLNENGLFTSEADAFSYLDFRKNYVETKRLEAGVPLDKSVYLPGESGRIRFLVTDQQGKPAAAALGVIVVDEAVYALQEMQPGLEKVYFTLQEELLKPQVQINFQPREGLGDLVRRPVLPAPQQQIAEDWRTACH